MPNSQAVFLSYASQDAAAAQRVRDALREAGVEVWFDQSELRGGDAWDASIRRQIKECALFLPIISANTESRTEGYFRLEWRLAEHRSHLMAKGRPFLLPIVIDATPDSQAHVPDAFLEVQWSRLPEGRCDEPFVARVKALLSGEVRRPASPSPMAATAAGRPALNRLPPWMAAVGAIALVAVLGFVAVWMMRPGADSSASRGSSPSSQQHGDSTIARSAANPSAGPARELVAKARALLDDDPLMTRRNVELAEQLALEAIAKDPSDAEAYAVAAWANFRHLLENYEDTPKRRADLRNYAERAKLLAPDSINAELALCGVLIVTKDTAEAIRRLASLADRAPDNLTVLTTHAWLTTISPRRGDTERVDPAWGAANDDPEPALARLRAHSPLGRSYADSFRASVHWGRGEYVEADRLIDGVFASGQPVRLSYLNRMLILAFGWGDMGAAREFAAKMPSKLLLEDVFIMHVSTIWLWSGDAEKSLQTLERTQRPMLHEALIVLPTAMRRGLAHAAAGRQGAASLQWREALKVVEELLQANPDSDALRENRALLLALLGERKAAAAQHALNLEMRPRVAGSISWGRDYRYHLLMGDIDGAIARLDRLMAIDNGRWPNVYNALRYDPALLTLRNDPRAKPMLARGGKWLAEKRRPGKAGKD